MLKQCQTIQNSSERLACYDKMLPPIKDEAKAETLPDVGKWQTSTETSPVDDSKNIYLSLSAEQTISTGLDHGVTPQIWITCREKKTNLYIDWSTFLGTEETEVLYRLGKNKAKVANWDMSTDNKAVFYRGNVVSFIKTLMQTNTMFVRVVPYGESPVSTSFTITGLKDAIKPLQQACGWK
ncbi:type VI secretion protein [Salmonella enterica]|nr:type VI secretion protein [Salmonella enterica]EBI9231635.1 type VI secretion protein [Salmonella enterica]